MQCICEMKIETLMFVLDIQNSNKWFRNEYRLKIRVLVSIITLTNREMSYLYS